MIEQTQLFTKEECIKIINYAEANSNWERMESRSTDDVKYKYFVNDMSDYDFVADRFVLYVKEKLNYNLSYPTILVLKYIPGDFFGKHIDSNNNETFSHDGIENVNTILNDTFTGGEFYLDNKKITTTPGNVYHYKSSTYHEVTEVIDGVRYSLLCYVRTRNLIKKETKSFL